VDFVLVLHSHLPWVLGHGRWPHGSDWLSEAVLESYLPMLDVLDTLERERVPAPATIGVTPVLANQLASPACAQEFRLLAAGRIAACDDAEREYASAGNERLAANVRAWRATLQQRVRQFEAIDGDLLGALRRHAGAGRIELISSAATHAFLPLLARDESIELQLRVGRAEHQRLFGTAPAGCWLPECAYRPAGPWAPWPGAPISAMRAGLESHLSAAGYAYVVIDAHMAHAGQPLHAYDTGHTRLHLAAMRSPHADYTIGRGPDAVRLLVRDPASTRLVWSRAEGYPGAAPYLEFHKMRFPGGLRLWAVTAPRTDLGAKQPYDARIAREQARHHAEHFAGVLRAQARHAKDADEVMVAPFDTELFGHWWYEGPDFLADAYRALRGDTQVRPTTAGAHVRRVRRATPLDVPAGSWGRDGDFGMWLNARTAPLWRRAWALEERFWRAAADVAGDALLEPILAQAARELLLMQSSDWPFLISTGEVADYASQRFAGHADALDTLLVALEGRRVDTVTSLMAALHARDDVFPDILDAVASVVRGATVGA
jgi:1,4-alpha-glucan branching enzyme